MSIFVANCPRCKANQITFDALAADLVGHGVASWQLRYEAMGRCRRCYRSTIFILELIEYKLFDRSGGKIQVTELGALAELFRPISHISLKDEINFQPPEFLPAEIDSIYREGVTCLSVKCYNAASTMFRLVLDKATKPLLPAAESTDTSQPNAKQRRDLGLRIPWLIENGFLSKDLGELMDSVREDGNDGAHQGDVSEDDAQDLLDFTTLLLTRLYTEPGRLRVAADRRESRRAARTIRS